MARECDLKQCYKRIKLLTFFVNALSSWGGGGDCRAFFFSLFFIFTCCLALCYRTHENSQRKGEVQTLPADKKKYNDDMF